MTDRFCVTNDLELVHPADRPRRCTAKVQDATGRWVPAHYAACADPESCRGCVPRDADNGWLCRACYAKVRDALTRVGELIVHLRSIEKAPQALGERVDTSMEKSIIVPETWIAADGLMEALGARPIPSTASIDETFALARAAVDEWADLDAIVQTREGAKRAVVMVKRMQTALRRWPDSEAQYRYVPHVRCPNCRQLTLWRRAPALVGDDLVIECSDSPLMYDDVDSYPYCEWRQDWFEWLDEYKPYIEWVFRQEDRLARELRKAIA